jgi:hypothetical protein
MTPAAIKRLEAIIAGVAARTASAADSLVDELRTSGMSEASIIERVKAEMQAGKLLNEMRQFAGVRAPGIIADSVFRFARDTLSDRQKDIARFKEIEADIEKRNAEPPSDEQMAAVEAAMDSQGIDVSAWVADQEMSPPPDAILEDSYLWVAVQDNRTCSICEGNHGDVKTLSAWVDIGEPRSGACLGDQSCRCLLVAVDTMTSEQQSALKDMGPIKV